MIELDGIGKLTSPVIIAAFEGWNDAGEAASGVINHLSLAWQAAPVGAIDPEDYYDFQVTRPVTEVTESSPSSPQPAPKALASRTTTGSDPVRLREIVSPEKFACTSTV